MTETARKKKHCIIEQGVGEPGRLDSNWVSLEQQEKMGEGMGSCLRRNDGGWGLAEVGDYLLG